jgi:PAS domain S-box-containing protein
MKNLIHQKIFHIIVGSFGAVLTLLYLVIEYLHFGTLSQFFEHISKKEAPTHITLFAMIFLFGILGLFLHWGSSLILSDSGNLEKLVEDRTLELKKAHELHESYIFSVADGLRNPLQVFMGELELMETGNLNPEQLESIEVIQRYCDKLKENIFFLTNRAGLQKAEKAIMESEEKFRTIAEQSPNMIFINRGGRVIYVNKKCEEKIGYTREEFYAAGFNFLGIIAPEFMDVVRANYLKHMQGQEIEPYEYTLIAKGGARIHGLHTTSLINYSGEQAILGIVTDITELKKTEEKVRISEEKFRTLFQMATDGILLSELDGTIIDANQTARELLDLEKEELLTRNIAEIVSEESLSRMKEILEVIKKGGSEIFEAIFHKKDGTPVPVEVNSTIMEFGTKKLVLSIARNVSRRKEMENVFKIISEGTTLQIRQGFFQSIVKSLAESLKADYAFIGKLKADGQTVHTVSFFARGRIVDNMEYTLKDTPCENVVGRKICSYAQNVKNKFPKAEMLIKMQIESFVGAPLFDSESRPLGLIVVMNDKPLENEMLIESVLQVYANRVALELERTLAENKIAELAELNEDIVRNAPVGILTLELSGKLKSANQAFLDMMGSPSLEETLKLGMGTAAVVKAGIGAAFQKTIATGEPFTLERIPYQSHWGRELYIDIKGVPQKDREGRLTGLIVVVKDVTEVVLSGKRLLKYTAEMEKANQFKDIFCDILSHDLMSPAGIIKTSAEMLNNEIQGESRELLDLIRQNIERQIKMIKEADILTRLDAGLDLNQESLDLKVILEKLIIETGVIFREREIQVENRITEPLFIKCSPMLSQVFLNIFTNAAQYAAEGKKFIIGLQKENGAARLFFQDFGPGMDDDLKKNIFMRFKKAGTKGIKGRGLGLTIAERIVELHQGKIWVEDNPAGGCVFNVSLPMGDGAVSAS